MNRPWQHYLRAWSLYAVFVFCVLFIQSLPLETAPRAYVFPDVILAVTFVLALRHPHYASPILVAAALLLTDFMLHRPPGLWSSIVLVAMITLRGRSADLHEAVFGAEWAIAAVAIIACFSANHIIRMFTFLQTDNLLLAVLQAFLTILSYPLIVWLMAFFNRKRTSRSMDNKPAKAAK